MIIDINKFVFLMNIEETARLTNVCNVDKEDLLFNTINCENKSIFNNYQKRLKENTIDFVDSNIIDNILNAQELRVDSNINLDVTRLFLNHDSLYLHFYINIVKYIYYLVKLDINLIDKSVTHDDYRITFIHRDIINQMLEPFYLHNKKTSRPIRINNLLEKFNRAEIIENNKLYKPFIITPYNYVNINIPNKEKANWYKVEFNKKIHNDYSNIKDKSKNHTYTKLPVNLYEQIGKNTSKSKEHQLYYSFIVSLLKTNTNNIECIERDEKDFKLYVPNNLKTMINNKIYIRQNIKQTITKFNNIESVSNNIRNKTKYLLPNRINIIEDNLFEIFYI